MTVQPKLDLSPPVSDEIRKTTCYMCACRCGINVHMKDGKVAYIEGNRDHPVNKGVLCAKGSAGIMNYKSPARLSKPLKRVGPNTEMRFSNTGSIKILYPSMLISREEWPSQVNLFPEPVSKSAFSAAR